VGLRVARGAHRLRSKAYSAVSGARLRRYLGARAARGWREELMNVADLEGAFTPWLERLEPDILHLHDIHLLGAGVNAKRALAARGAKVRAIYDAHEYVKGMHGPNPYQVAAYAQMERELVGEMDGVTTVSEEIADMLERDLSLPRRPTVVLNSPPADAGRAKAAETVRERVGLGPKTPLVVYAGVLHTNRNLLPLVDAFREIPGAHLAIVCVPSTRGWGADIVRARVAEQGLGGRIHLVEPVAPEQVVGFLSGAWMGVHPMATGLPNHEMALPNKLFDYVWAGLPVAVSRVRTMASFVADAGIGASFDPEDPADVARAIREVLADRERLAANARSEELRRRYAWERQAEKLAGLYGLIDPS
jgi:glycosyltransferase involved in cell wall biosynthesis